MSGGWCLALPGAGGVSGRSEGLGAQVSTHPRTGAEAGHTLDICPGSRRGGASPLRKD